VSHPGGHQERPKLPSCGEPAVVVQPTFLLRIALNLEARVGIELRSPTESTQVIDFARRSERYNRHNRPSPVHFPYT
jgi:hypothetical protein